jgi:ABC-type phosphate/phosphonate transport system substrate-binding protein
VTVGVDRQHAVLGMYPFPSARRGYDLLWEGIHARLPETPALLDWSADPHSSWREPGLVLGQACGWPLMTELRGVVRVVGTFAPSVPYARDHRYRSVLLTRRRAARVPEASEFAGRTAAANISRSLSGWVSLLHAVHGPGSTWQGPVVWTGAHADSVRAVFEGRADVMSIDSVTLALLRREIPEVIDELVEIGLGPEVPALPLIARGSTSDEELAALRRAIVEAFEQRPEIGESIMAERFVPLDETAYECVLGLGPSGDGTRAG